MNKYRVRNVYDLGNTIRIRIITEDNVEKCFVPIEATLNDLYLYYFDEVSEYYLYLFHLCLITIHFFAFSHQM